MLAATTDAASNFPHVPNRGGATIKTSKGTATPQRDHSSDQTTTQSSRSSPKDSQSTKITPQQPHNDPLIEASFIAETKLPTDFGDFRLRAYRTRPSENVHQGNEPMVIYSADKPPFGKGGELVEGLPVRVHDQCMTSEVFGSNRCDCKEQLRMALEEIKETGGAVIYLQQEGRGIGLANKVAAYSLQDEGYDTVDANLRLGFAADARQYGMIPSILADMQIASIQLMTNNPRKVNRLAALGVKVDNTLPMVVHQANQHNRKYLETKQRRMNHANFGDMLQRDVTADSSGNGYMAPNKRRDFDFEDSSSDDEVVQQRPKLLGGATGSNNSKHQ